MHKLRIKPLSVNEAFKGKRYRTVKYIKFKRDVFMLLPKIKLPAPPFELHLHFGFSSSASDIDNPVKTFIDQLQDKYSFDDKLINKLIVEKSKVKKGNEFIEFELIHYEKNN